jgi:carboxypeptidase C (cathepsin A)
MIRGRVRLAVVVFGTLGTVAADVPAQVDTVPGIATAIVTTKHRITLAGKPLAYTARSGVLPIRLNDTGEPRGYVFFVAYTVERAPNDPPRPLTFAWNGGPGSNALLLHLSALGPRRITSNEDPPAAATPVAIEDNHATWLAATDLVLVDPIGTGFSRPARPEYADDFYGVRGDIAATVEFIRTYRTRFDAWDAPLYLAGESYGVWRAAGAGEAIERAGERVAGLILISGGMPLGPVVPDAMRTAMFIPTRTASAFFHRKLPPDLQADRNRAVGEAERWARSVYGPALARVDSLRPAERDTIAAQLARFTGLDVRAVDRTSLVVDRQFLLDHLLEDRRQGSLGRFDTRQVGSPRSDRAADARRRTVINRYLRDELGFETDLAYQGLETGYSSAEPAPPGVNARWKYDQGDPNVPVVVKNTDGPPGGTPPWLARALELDPDLRAFVATGIYDSLNSCSGNSYVLGQLAPERAARITFRCYEGGHMVYEDENARFQLQRDITAFYSARRPPSSR